MRSIHDLRLNNRLCHQAPCWPAILATVAALLLVVNRPTIAELPAGASRGRGWRGTKNSWSRSGHREFPWPSLSTASSASSAATAWPISKTRCPPPQETIYRLASISKMLTAVAAMQLVEQSKLDLAAPIQKYVPELSRKAGSDHRRAVAQASKRHSALQGGRGSQQRLLQPRGRLARRSSRTIRCLFTPGEKFSYTTYGYNLLGAAIEGASGQDYVSYVQEHVCRPAGMTDDPARQSLQDYSAPRGRVSAQDARTQERDSSTTFRSTSRTRFPAAAGARPPATWPDSPSRWSTASWSDSQTLEQMWTAQKTAKGEQTTYGLGCVVGSYKGDQRISHSGGQPKVATFLILAPTKRAAVAVMCNLNGAPCKRLAGELLGIATGGD